MTAHESSRTLVKSTPELWAECSDPAALARHLGSVGEIRITRLEPETTVAWEGAAARGTVRLQTAGWGTRVTLTITEEEASPGGAPAPEQRTESASQPAPERAAAPDRPGRIAVLLWRLRRRPGNLDATANPPVPEPREQTAEAPAEAPSPPAGSARTLDAALDSLGRPHRRPYSRA